MNSGTNTYRYKKGNPVSWQVPISSMMIQKEVEIDGQKKKLLKKVAYYPGSSSIFVEDNLKSDTPKKNIWLEDQGNGFTELYVPKDDYILNQLLQNCPKFNVDFELYNADSKATAELAEYEMKEEALEALSDMNDYQAQGTAFAVFGYSAFTWTPTRAKAELKKKAFDAPKVILEKMKEKDYESKLIAGQAYHKGIIESDKTETNVIWTDSGEIITNISTGQLGVEKLAEFLSQKSEESLSVLQRIGAILNAGKAKAKEAFEEIENDVLAQAKKDYKEKFDKEVPVNKSNDVAWITAKLAE